MKHLILCREYPPAPGGGIGTYAFHISRLLAESGETVHVISQLWKGAEEEIKESHNGKLIVHRVPFQDWTPFRGWRPSPLIKSTKVRDLFYSGFSSQCFSWQASLIGEKIVKEEGIDIIEAPEYEAPLYYFQIRRALGFGPKNQPPCIIYLHSPTEFIVRHDDLNLGQEYYIAAITAKRLEDYSVLTADSLLCPSKYLASQLEHHYGFEKGIINVIPYPLGDSIKLKRDENTWKNGTICYVGRLELRKGITEWIEAAVEVAQEYPDVTFEFIGRNILLPDPISAEEFVNRQIPKDLKERFHFRGPIKHSKIPSFLAKSRLAVVPSRWENFPYTCIEFMASGLPVIATREGGMAEMIEDGRTGWLVNLPGRKGLAEALKRALETPWIKLVDMGDNASTAIRRICDNEKIVNDQLKLRYQIAEQSPKKSLFLPVNLPWSKFSTRSTSPRKIAKYQDKSGLLIIIICKSSSKTLRECLSSIFHQTKKPEKIIILYLKSSEKQNFKTLDTNQIENCQIIDKRNSSDAQAKNDAIELILNSDLNPLGIAFIDSEDRIEPDFIFICESVLKHCPEVGLISTWAIDLNKKVKTWIKPCPSFPYQWVMNDAGSFSVIRTESIIEVGKFRSNMNNGYECWDLFNAVMAEGWIAVTIPETLVKHDFTENPIEATYEGDSAKMRSELLGRFPELISRDAEEIILLTESHTRHLIYKDTFTLHKKISTLKNMLRHPLSTTFWAIGKIKDEIL